MASLVHIVCEIFGKESITMIKGKASFCLVIQSLLLTDMSLVY